MAWLSATDSNRIIAKPYPFQISETFDRATFCPLPGFLPVFFSAFLPAFVSIFLSLFDSLSFFGIFVRPCCTKVIACAALAKSPVL